MWRLGEAALCGFAIIWKTMAFTGGAPLLLRLWGVPFVQMGRKIVFGGLSSMT
jgi:hypothetical protein